MKVFIAADHRGFELKQKLTAFLAQKNIEVIDCGNAALDLDDDFPVFVHTLHEKMKLDPTSKGIVACGSGVGVSIAANRYPEIRCGLCFTEKQVQSARAEDDINVLAIPTEYISEELAQTLCTLFLETPASNAPRYLRRIAEINSYGNSTNTSR